MFQYSSAQADDGSLSRGEAMVLRSVSSRKVMSMPTVSGPWLSTTIPPYLTKPVAAERAPTPKQHQQQ